MAGSKLQRVTMYAVKLPSGEFLDTPENLNLQFDLVNQVFTTSSTDVLPGSFSFPVEVPLTDRMRLQLGHPDRVTSARTVYEIPDVWVYCEGKRLFFGTLRISKANRRKCSITVIANPLAKLKITNLGELDFGGLRSTGPMLFHVFMKTTAENPENYDFAFFPVENPNANSFPDIEGDPQPLADQCFQNFYSHLGSQEFSEASGACTPFLRLDYLLSRIFAVDNTGFQFENGWQIEEELRRLYVYNTADIRILDNSGNPSLPITFTLNQFVPNVKCTEFVKKVMAQHGLGLFTNVFLTRIRLLPLSTVLQRPAVADWTQYAVGEPELDERDLPPTLFGYEQSGDTLPADFPPLYNLTTYATLEEMNADVPGEGYYYVEAPGLAVKVEPLKANRYMAFAGVKVGDNGETYEAGMDCLPSRERYYHSPVECSRFHKVQDDDGTHYERRDVESPCALMWYRGLQTVGGDFIEDVGIIPYAANHVWAPGSGSPASRNKITSTGATPVESSRSLNWFGETGLYNQAHRLWQEMLRNGKPVLQSFALPLIVLTAFSFEDKVRHQSMDYFIKKLRIEKNLGRGKILVQASMVSTV